MLSRSSSKNAKNNFFKRDKKEKAKKSAKIFGVGNTHVPGKNKFRSVTSVVLVCKKVILYF
jgi:hypothetical protein